MFENKIFEILSVDFPAENEAAARINILSNHEIFKGHFPDNPVLPGVVSIQIISDFFAHITSQNYFLSEASNVKFLKIIQVQNNVQLSVKVKFSPFADKKYKVSAEIFNENDIFLKFSGIFV